MPNIKSAKKRVLVQAKKAEVNKNAKTALKTFVKKANLAVSEGKAQDPAIKVAAVKLDQAAAKGLIHKNKAARLKSRMAKKVNAIAQ